jgi:4-hydroxysphinganine ceramide fatty acyl 2-hydroxylase
MWLLFLLTGIIAWTFSEYMLHRFLGHVHKGKNFFKSEHQVHHSIANYFAPFYKKGIAAFIVAVVMLLMLSLIFSMLNAAAFVSGFIGMYCLYENTHYRYHSTEPLARPFIILRKHHFYHHFHNPNVNHGVTTRFWDRVFGTFVKVEKVKVPQRMSMNWLVSGNEVKKVYSKHFQLNSR